MIGGWVSNSDLKKRQLIIVNTKDDWREVGLMEKLKKLTGKIYSATAGELAGY